MRLVTSEELDLLIGLYYVLINTEKMPCIEERGKFLNLPCIGIIIGLSLCIKIVQKKLFLFIGLLHQHLSQTLTI